MVITVESDATPVRLEVLLTIDPAARLEMEAHATPSTVAVMLAVTVGVTGGAAVSSESSLLQPAKPITIAENNKLVVDLIFKFIKFKGLSEYFKMECEGKAR